MLFSLYLDNMKKIRNIIFLYWTIAVGISLSVTFLISSFLHNNFKEPTFTLVGSFSFGLTSALLFYMFEKKFLNLISVTTENIEVISYQLSQILVKQNGETNLIELKFVRMGSEFCLKIQTLKKVGIYQDVTLENIKLKRNKFYDLSFFVKKYENKYDTHCFHKEPVSIDYMRISNFEDYYFKSSKKIKPSLYLVK